MLEILFSQTRKIHYPLMKYLRQVIFLLISPSTCHFTSLHKVLTMYQAKDEGSIGFTS